MKSFSITLPSVSLTESSLRLKSKEIKNYSLMLWPERRPLRTSKNPKDKPEDEKSSNFNNTTSRVPVTNKPTKN